MIVPRLTRNILVATLAFLAIPPLIVPVLCKGQVVDDTLSRHTLYVEGLGNTEAAASLNYEYAVTTAYRLRVGFSPCVPRASRCFSEDLKQNGVLTLLLSRLFRHGPKSSDGIEVGGGISLQRWPFARVAHWDIDVAATGVLGYRYQPTAGGPVFRVGWTPLYSERRTRIRWGGVSVGYTF